MPTRGPRCWFPFEEFGCGLCLDLGGANVERLGYCSGIMYRNIYNSLSKKVVNQLAHVCRLNLWHSI